ncbi:MAG: hypothetical protein A3D24_01245 [Candidatus Blackburnbacteria bacterium RIFCSPHIGHO2_02_FULL_39_13]|nr:MAG: hypothetical protein A3D24_01245 [Candidatus Blackburnbacteria bacterium RIFCSPHIGHO2_02_FULL_39_13]OGY15229.1 MAG: hypothetical protein A3I52_00150 [Candidatus Blackburnbacteria bacterium RIFCSPLOWO2_02_FULL_40_10]
MSNLKDFLATFNINNPDWTNIPQNFPNCDLNDLTSEEIGKFNAAKTVWEFSKPKQPLQRSRVWKHPQGYKYLVQWSNALLLRFILRKLTANLPAAEFRSRPQLNDAGRSQVRNIEEGWKRPTTSQYLDYLGFSQASLEETKCDVRDITQDGFLKSKPGSSLKDLGIDLREFHKVISSSTRPLPSFSGPLKDVKGKLEEVRGFRSLESIYPPLAKIRAQDLTYEILMELINKTDYLLRVLVESLEKKMDKDKKGYQVEQARIKGNLKKK